MKTPQKETAKSDNLMRPSDKIRVDQIERELDDFLKNPRAEEILLNEWFDDGALPIPSPELLEYFAMELLYGFGKYERFANAGQMGTVEAVRLYVAELRGISSSSRRDSICFATARRKILGFGGATQNVLHWWPVIMALNSDLSKLPVIASGQRRLTRLLVESMSLRAVLQNDGLGLDGLAEAVRVNSGTSALKPTMSETIAFQILRWHPYLSRELKRNPSKTELEVFLRGVYPGISESAATWTEARKLIRVRAAAPRSQRIDRDQINKLALKARKKGPDVGRLPSWRQPSHFGTGEDLQ